MWRNLVVVVCAAVVLLAVTWTGNVGIIKPRTALAQGVPVMSVVPEHIEDLSSHPRLLLDAQIETPAQNNSVPTLPEVKAGDGIRFQLFAPDLAGQRSVGMVVELALRSKTFGSYIDDITYSGPFALQLGAAGATLTVASLPAVTVAASGYLGQVTLSVRRALTSSDVLSVRSAEVSSADRAENLDVSEAVLTFGQQMQLQLDTRIESPPQNNDVLELPEKRAGDTIQFQLFVPDAGGRQIQAYTVELALKGKTFDSYFDDVSGMDLTGAALLSGAAGSGNPTLSMLSLSAMSVPSSGYLGQVTLRVSRALTSSDALEVASAEVGSTDGVETLDVSQALLTFTAAACPGDFDGNGMVNLSDFLAFAGAFGTRSGDANYNARTDMDGSGAVDLSDFLAFAGVFGTTCEAPPPTVVSIPDANLRAVIEDKLGKASGAPIMHAEMATLTRLDAPNSGIRDLTGLEFATGLTVLRLDPESVSTLDNSNDISDLSPLLGLTDLTRLYLDGNDITDVSALSGLTNLERLGLGDNRITDLTALSGLSNLIRLGLHRNGITDLSALSGLTGLKEVNLGFNDLTDVSALSGLTSLTTLRLFGNSITGVSAVSGLTDLTTLDFRWNRNITDVSALSGLTNLRSLYLAGNSITDVSALSGLTNLTRLYLDDNSITDVSALSALTNLQEILDLSSNNIADVSPLSALYDLGTLDLGGNSLADVSALSNLTNLLGLYLDNNSIVDISPLSGLTKLRTLHLYNNSITDLAPLVANTGLGSGDEVGVRGNPLSTTSINVHIPALEARGVSVLFDAIIVFTDPAIYNDNVFVMPVTENLAAGNLPLDKYAVRFYEHFSDAFDFQIFIPSLNGSQLDPEAFGGAFYASVSNEVQGTGQSIYADGRWGSAG